MQAEAWATLGVGLTTLGGVLVAWLANRAQTSRVEAKIDTAADIASAAVDNTKHVSNGFASKTTDGIDAILAGQRRLEAALALLAAAQGRTDGRLDHAIERLDNHLGEPVHGRVESTDGSM